MPFGIFPDRAHATPVIVSPQEHTQGPYDLSSITGESFIYDYRSLDGSQYFCFEFEDHAPDGWAISILNDVDYGFLPQDLHSTHRGLRDDGYTICWDGYLATLEEAMVIASLWADTTALYVKGLGDFDTIANILREF